MTGESGNTLRIVEIMGMERIATPARKLVFCSDKLTMVLIKILLRVHSFSYRAVGFLAATPAEGNLHPKHRIMNYHAFFVDNVNEDDTVLDIGCGNGALTYDVAKKAGQVVGIDLNEKSISLARQRYSRGNIGYICGNVLNDLPDERFDVVILSNVLEHIDERVKFLKRLREMAPQFLIRVPMINRDWITLYKKEVGLDYRLDKDHYIEYTLETFEYELSKAGLQIQEYGIQFGEIWAAVSG